MSAETIVTQYLGKLRTQFYRDDKSFHQQRRYLIQAVTFPARWLDKRGVFLPESDYREILDTIISGVQKHADLRAIRHFGVYFLDCVQRHIKHHEEQYYDHAKGLREKARLAMRDTIAGVKVADSSPDASTGLAALHKLVKSPGRRPKKSSSVGATQMGLL